MMKRHVAVVGGGLAGLTAAAYLGRSGHRVTVLEKARATGGRAGTTEKDGFSMNLGPHALYLGGRAEAILDELGVSAPGRIAAGSGGYAMRGDDLFTLPSGPVSLLTTGLFGLADKLEVGRLLASAGKLDPRPFDRVPVSRWLRDSIRNEGARALVATILRVATYGGDFDRMSAGGALDQLKLAVTAGVRYVDGGWVTIASGLERLARASGAEVRTGAKVEGLVLESGEVRGLRLAGGEELAADAVVMAGSARAAASLCPESRALATYADRVVPVEAACLDLCLSRLPKPRTLVVFPVDRPLYFSVHSASARLAPAGAALIHVARYGGGGEGVEAELEAFVDRLQPGWRDALVHRRFLPALVANSALVEAEAGGPSGRLDVDAAGVPGLFLAGDWVGPEGLLADAAMASAKRAALQITGARVKQQAA